MEKPQVHARVEGQRARGVMICKGEAAWIDGESKVDASETLKEQ